MSVHDGLDEFCAALPALRALAGLDLGEKTIGLAVSDRYRSIASPLLTIRRRKFSLDAAEILRLAQEKSADAFHCRPTQPIRGLGAVKCNVRSEDHIGPACRATWMGPKGRAASRPGPLPAT